MKKVNWRKNRVRFGSKSLVSLAISLSSSFAFAAAGESCFDLFSFQSGFGKAQDRQPPHLGDDAKLDWLRTSSAARDQWINARAHEVNDEMARSKNFVPMETFFHKLFDEGEKVSGKVSNDGVSVWLENSGVQVKYPEQNASVYKPTLVKVQKDNQAPFVIFKSTDLQMNNNYMPTHVQISPDRKYISVANSRQGSLDRYMHIIFSTETLKEVARISDVDKETIVWQTPDSFYFETALHHKNMIASLNGDKLTVSDTNPFLFPKSSDDGKNLFFNESAKSVLKRFGDSADKEWVLPNLLIQDVPYLSSKKAVILVGGHRGFKELQVWERSEPGQPPEKTGLLLKGSDWVIESAKLFEGAIVAKSFRGIERRMNIFDLSSNLASKKTVDIALPASCDAALQTVSFDKGEALFLLSSPVRKAVPWKYDFNTAKWFVQTKNTWKLAEVDSEMLKADGVEYVVNYVNVKSADGQLIPVRITSRNDLKKDRSNPVIARAYGGFNANSDFYPAYGAMTADFLKKGGIHIAVATRGGGFFGTPWHDAGRALNKQNVVLDFVAALEWTLQEGWTSPQKIAISGGSHGGLLMGAVLTQRPDLVGLAFPQFGPLDFLHKPQLDIYTAPLQVHEYGNLANDQKAIAAAQKLSPFANANPNVYPMTVVITGRNDSRVNPAHSYLFAEKLRENQRGPAPIYLFALKNSGHWAAAEPLQDSIAWRWNSVYWTFIYDYFGMKAPVYNP